MFFINGIRTLYNERPRTLINCVTGFLGSAAHSPQLGVGLFIISELGAPLIDSCSHYVKDYGCRAAKRVWEKCFYPNPDEARQEALGRETSVIAIPRQLLTRDLVLFSGAASAFMGVAALADLFRRCRNVEIIAWQYYVLPSFEKVEQCEWNHQIIVLFTGSIALHGVTFLLYRAKNGALRRDLDRQGTATQTLAVQVGVHGTAIHTNTVAVRSLAGQVGIHGTAIHTNTFAVQSLAAFTGHLSQRVDDHDREISALRGQCGEIVQKLEDVISDLFKLRSNEGIQTILKEPEIIAKLSRSQDRRAEALREQKFIKKRLHLKTYYHAVCQRFNGVYMACLIIKSGWVAPNELQNFDDFLREALGALPVPGMRILTSILGAAQAAKKQRMVNQLCRSFGPDLATDLKYFERLARYLTLNQKKAIAHPPPLDLAPTVFHAAKDVIVDDEGSDPVVHKARKDCEKIFRSMLDKKVIVGTDFETVLAILTPQAFAMPYVDPAVMKRISMNIGQPFDFGQVSGDV